MSSDRVSHSFSERIQVGPDARNDAEPIAIVGIGCRFPGANGPEELWSMLCNGVDAIREVPADRWNADAYYDVRPNRPGKMVTRWGGFVDQKLGTFDAAFFGMSPREAAHLDPMQAWLMEVSWEALEDAGIRPETLAGTASGVFIGMFTEDAKISYLRGSNRDLIGPHTGTGTSMTLAANRLSYWYDLRGPSIALDTACSSSLVAVHLACRSLLQGESTLALAGGVNAMFQPEFTIAESRAGMLSPDGRCKTWDAHANGYVRGEGAGIVVLKRLSDARRDGNVIHALIRATGVNQDGKTIGVTVPNGIAQANLARETLDRAGVHADSICYVEAHGTGTPVGDPIEVRALGEVFGKGRSDGRACPIGSLKTNIGHLEAAAGVAGLIKAALVLKHKRIPPHLHLRQPNPEIDFDNLRLRPIREVEALTAVNGRACAAVNSFGFGGTNAHAILEEAPPRRPQESTVRRATPALIPISARSPVSLEHALRDFCALAKDSSVDAGADFHTFATATALRRTSQPHRVAIVASTFAELGAALDLHLSGSESKIVASGRISKFDLAEVTFVYTGMGPQWWKMGRALLEREPVFLNAINRCDAIIRPWSGWSLREELMRDAEASRMGETQISQPANFALQVALTELLHSWGVSPTAIIGHSAGEAAAFWAAGVYTLEEACLVIYTRSRLQERTAGQGKLYAVGLSYAEALAAIEGCHGVSIAAINSPSAVTLAGDSNELDTIVASIAQNGHFVKALRVDVPFHSHYMDPLREELVASLASLAPARAQVPLYSTVHGGRVQGPELDAHYWWQNVREPVFFAAATYHLLEDGARLFLELGPHPVLTNSIIECAETRSVNVSAIATLRRDAEADRSLLAALGSLFTRGIEPNWAALHREDISQIAVDLPRYSWDRQWNWEESAEARSDRLGPADHPLLGRRQTTPQPVWLNQVDRNWPPYLEGHNVGGAVVFPGAGFLEIGLQALRRATGRTQGSVELGDVHFDSALFLREEPSDLRTEIDLENLSFRIYSRPSVIDAKWDVHCSGTMRNSRPTRSSPHSLAEAQNTLAHARRIEHQAVYQQLAELGFAYHGAFRGVQELSVRDGEVLARIAVVQEHHLSLTGYEIAPPFLDACFHALLLGYAGTRDPGDVLLPIGIDRLVSHAPLEEVGWVHGTMHSSDARMMVADLIVYADDGRTLLALEGLRIKSIRANQDAKTLAALFHTLEWRAIDGEAKRETAAGTGSWLVLGDQTERGKELVAEIRGNGGRVCQVQRGPTFERAPREELLFSMDPNQVDAFDRLFATLHEVDFLPSRVIYLWALDAPEPEDRCGRSLMRAQQVGVLALLHLVQAIERIKWPRLPELWIFTRGARQVGDTPYPVSLTQTPLNGFAAALFHQEHPELAGGIIDLDPVQRRGEGEKVIHLLQRPPLDREIAMRGDTLYGQRLAVAPHLAQGTLPARMRADASYLISGGRGGLGLEMARWLISRGARRLILAGRSPLPERSQWPNLDRRSSTWKTVEQIRRLEAMGASILTPVLDVADDDALAAYYESFRREGWPALRGVIHAAGIVQPMRLSALRSESFENTLAPKVAGAWNLYSLLKDEPLDFFIACSSANALGFSTGVIDYAAANAFLDGLAHHARFEKRPLLAINWGAWGEVGMASNVDVSHDFILRGILPIAPKQGIEAIERSLEHDLTQVLVLAANWQRLLSNFSAAELPVFVAPLVEQMKSSFGDARGDESGIKNLGVLLACLEDDDQRRAHLENFLIESVSRALKLPVDRIDLSQRLVDFGMDSIIAVELRQSIAAQLPVGPTLMEVLQGGSIASLRDTLLARLAPIWLEKDANTVAQTDEIGVETPKSDDEGLDDLARALSDLSPEARELLLRDFSAADDDRTCSETLRSFADELA